MHVVVAPHPSCWASHTRPASQALLPSGAQVDGAVSTPLKFSQVCAHLACQRDWLARAARLVAASLLTASASAPSMLNAAARVLVQAFHLVPEGGSWVIANDLFRLNVG
jgi:hypothetical protein